MTVTGEQQQEQQQQQQTRPNSRFGQMDDGNEGMGVISALAHSEIDDSYWRTTARAAATAANKAKLKVWANG